MNLAAMQAFVHALEPEIAHHLGNDLEDAREFSCVALYAMTKRKRLYQCSRESLKASILTAAKMRLVPGLGLGYLTVEEGEEGLEAVFVPTWRGFLQILRDHGDVLDAYSCVIHEKDLFRFKLGTRRRFEFEAYRNGPRGPMQGVFVALKLSGPGYIEEHVEVLWREDLDPVAPDGTDAPDSARGSMRDQEERSKTVAFKRAAKWVAARTRLGGEVIAAAIELERTVEKSRARARAVDVAQLLGIDVRESAPELRGEVVEAATPTLSEAVLIRTGERCCACGNSGRFLTSYSIHPRLWRGCNGCGGLGVRHELCSGCLKEHDAGRKEIEAAEQKDDARRRAIAMNVRQAGSAVVEQRIKKSRKKTLGEQLGVKPGSSPLADEEEKQEGGEVGAALNALSTVAASDRADSSQQPIPPRAALPPAATGSYSTASTKEAPCGALVEANAEDAKGLSSGPSSSAFNSKASSESSPRGPSEKVTAGTLNDERESTGNEPVSAGIQEATPPFGTGAVPADW